MAVAGELSRLGDPGAAAAALAEGKQDLRSLRARAGFLSAAEDKQGLSKLYDETKAAARGEADGDWLLLLGQLAEALERHDEALDRSEEHTSELQSLMRLSYAVFCL